MSTYLGGRENETFDRRKEKDGRSTLQYASKVKQNCLISNVIYFLFEIFFIGLILIYIRFEDMYDFLTLGLSF
jgi:hypothetical protein